MQSHLGAELFGVRRASRYSWRQAISSQDEWYFNMRFAGDIAGNERAELEGTVFTPILVASPSDDVRNGPYVYPAGPYPHIVANRVEPKR